MGWPEPAPSRLASASTLASTAAADRRSRLARSPGATARQLRCAAAARAMAAPVSSAETCITVVTGCSVAGFSTVNWAMTGVASPCLRAGWSDRGADTGLETLEAALQLPVGHGGVVGLELDPGVVGVVLDHLGAERLAGEIALLPQLERVAQGVRHLGAGVQV